MQQIQKHTAITISAAAALVAIGVVYGDIGTSPMYVMKSIMAGNGGLAAMNSQLVLGSLSLIIWTLTLLTTVKYVLVAMQADNHGESGIFSLYSILRRNGKYLVFFAMIGGAALLADGVLTPAVTVTTAIEGLRSIPALDALLGVGQGRIVQITLLIIAVLFLIQRAGTSSIGKAFGPVMMVWFLFLGGLGIYRMGMDLSVLQALNPLLALHVLVGPYNKMGIFILGSVFLATTGAEALYSDMGHVGKGNIYISWPLVKICLILNYLGQGAWLIQHQNDASLYELEDLNPFFQMMPQGIRPVAVLLSTLAAIIASQALITGAFTMVAEACKLDLLPHMQVIYPSHTMGQLYIPLVNSCLWVGCSLLVLYFQSSHRMEAAYGLAITVTMLMTTLLLFVFLKTIKKKTVTAYCFLVLFGGLELMFLFSSLTKFLDGGYVAVTLAALLLAVMYIWHRGTQVEESQAIYLSVDKYKETLKRLRGDETVPCFADNLVYLTKSRYCNFVERDILYSILEKGPKRAKAYWFVNIHVEDVPYKKEYSVESFGTDYIFRVQLNLGFKENQRVNVYLRQIVQELMRSGELPHQQQNYAVQTPGIVGSFRFCIIRKRVVPESELSVSDQNILTAKYAIRHVAGSPARWYGLENSVLAVEYLPLFVKMKANAPLLRKKAAHREPAEPIKEHTVG